MREQKPPDSIVPRESVTVEDGVDVSEFQHWRVSRSTAFVTK